MSLNDELASKIAAISDASSAEDLLLLTAALNNITTDRIVSVATPDDLPTLTDFNFPSGCVFYVDSLNIPVISCNTKWIGIDGRVLREGLSSVAMAWGSNTYGKLGDTTTSSRSSPVPVVGGITNWSQVSAGGDHSLGLTTTGIAYAWGSYVYGELGDNTTGSRLSPVSVVGGIANWSQVSAGGDHSLGLTTDGIVYAWGGNVYGELGDNTANTRSSPVSVVGGITNWSQVSAGGDHSLGLTTDGIAYAWGYNGYGQLGDNTTTNTRSSPVSVVGGITNWSYVSAGQYHSLGLTTDGIAYAWGSNVYGRLGDNTQNDQSSPVSVVGGITNWSQVSAGYYHSLGVTTTGIAYAWGRNLNGELGDNTTSDRSSPVSVVGGITNWSQVSAGGLHSLGLTTDGKMYSWGYNGSGQLGDNTTSSRLSPVSVVGGITNWSQVSAGWNHSLGIKLS